MTCALPMFGAGLVLLARDGWWKRHARLSIQTVVAAWLASITAFGIMIYFQHGATTRSTFVLAVMHEQIELLLDCVLFGLPARHCFAITWLFGAVMILAVLTVPSMSTVFMLSSIIGGGNDGLMVLLFFYGKQYWFAFAAFGHVVSAVMVFTEVIKNIGVVTYNAIIFISLCIHVGGTVMGIMQLASSSGSDSGSYEQLPSPHHDDAENANHGIPNPLASTAWTREVLQKLVCLALFGSTGVTVYLAFILPANLGPLAQMAIFAGAGIVTAIILPFMF
ncbi:hypothetical protein EXIGLDRAFT_722940 [Exidia glandulosa HHB12029]|uniref:Uncharacterized protein n=1 Tax=Exidia glandulosa HHB12029 TaxID=1314781 RepID=A0A165F1F7_EXIGL|nr:hypothetical protein EXIGLDRAFT_722940 [Exidia glandulosa HHB12029]